METRSKSSSPKTRKRQREEAEPRIGEIYQAKIPKYRKNKHNAQIQFGKEGILIWSPKTYSDEDIREEEDYLKEAVKTCGHDIHSALGLLYWYRHDFDKARESLTKFHPEATFTSEEEDQFNEAVITGNKEQRMDILKDRLPNRSYKEIVRRYYQWRAGRKNISLMDTKVEAVELRIKEESDEVASRAEAARAAEEDDGLPPPPPSHGNHFPMSDEMGDDMSLEEDDEPEDPISIVRKKVLDEDLKEPRFTAKISKDELEDALHRRKTKSDTSAAQLDDEVARYKSEVQLAKQICSTLIVPVKLESPPSLDDLNSYIDTLRISKPGVLGVDDDVVADAADEDVVKCEVNGG